ncbi:MAG: NADH-quinone oxidoreductase subunit C [Bacteroidota bacterium]
MKNQDTFVASLKESKIQEFILGVRSYANELTIDVAAEKIYPVLAFLKEAKDFDYLSDITATDHYEDSERFEVSYNLVNLKAKQRIRVSCRVEEDDPSLDSIITLWESADWFEREAFDMVGIKFTNHPDLRRMFMPEDYPYFPLRKEFPLLGIPGSIPLPEKDPPKQYN